MSKSEVPIIYTDQILNETSKDFSTPDNETTSFSDNSISSSLLDLAVTVDQYYTPILCIFGVFGNCLSIIVFFTRTNKARGGLTSSVYLSALAISDTGFLINLFILWLNNIGIDLLANAFMCPTVMYLGQVTGFLSVWFIVAFTIDRCKAICHPLGPNLRFTGSRARRITAGLTLFAAVAFSYVCVIAQVIQIPSHDDEGMTENTTLTIDTMTWTHESLSRLSDREGGIYPDSSQCSSIYKVNISVPLNESILANSQRWECQHLNRIATQTNRSSTDQPLFICSVPRKFMKLSEISNYIDSVLTFIIPFIIIFCLNLKIIFCIKRFKGHREGLLANIKIAHRPRPSHCCSSSKSVAEPPKLKDVLTINGKTREQSQKSNIKNSNGSPICCCKCQEIKSTLTTNQNYRKSGNTRKSIKNGRDCLTNSKKSSIESDFQSFESADQITPPAKSISTKNSKAAMEVRVTKTLLLVSSVFLFLHFPSHSIRVASFIQSFGASVNTQKNLFVAQMWANLLFNTNFAVNFLLYCCSGKSFRRSVRNLLSCQHDYSSLLRTNTTTVMTTQINLNNTEVGITKKRACRQQNTCSNIRQPAEDQV